MENSYSTYTDNANFNASLRNDMAYTDVLKNCIRLECFVSNSCFKYFHIET